MRRPSAPLLAALATAAGLLPWTPAADEACPAGSPGCGALPGEEFTQLQRDVTKWQSQLDERLQRMEGKLEEVAKRQFQLAESVQRLNEKLEGERSSGGGDDRAAPPERAASPERSTTATGILGVDVLIPEAAPRVTTHLRPPRVPNECCWKSYQVLHDDRGKPIFVSAEDFLCNPAEITDLAQRPEREGLSWQLADIHPNPDVRDPVEAKLQGNGFPGQRLHVHNHRVGKMVTDCIEAIVEGVWPGFRVWSTADRQHSLGVISPERQPGGKWLDAQRTPHNDIVWSHGLLQPGGIVPPMLATVLSLTHDFNDTGTGLWRTKRTTRDPNERLSLLETLQENEVAQGVFSVKVKRRSPDKPIREEIPGPCPQQFTSHAWAEVVAVARAVYNRIVIYDGRRLHNQYAEPSACSRFTLNPAKGRLTMNSFLWHSSATAPAVPR